MTGDMDGRTLARALDMAVPALIREPGRIESADLDLFGRAEARVPDRLLLEWVRDRHDAGEKLPGDVDEVMEILTPDDLGGASPDVLLARYRDADDGRSATSALALIREVKAEAARPADGPPVDGLLASLGVRRIDVTAALGEPPPPVDWLLSGFLERGDFALLAGGAKAGKSLTVLALALHLLRDDVMTFLGRPIGSVPRLVYVDAENPERVVRRRLHLLGIPTDTAPRIDYMAARGLDLGSDDGRELLRRLVGDDCPLVILDSLIGLHRIDENASGEVRGLLDGLRTAAQDAGATVLALAHTPHAETRARGSTDWRAGVDQELGLAYSRAEGTRTLAVHGMRGDDSAEPIVFRFQDDGGRLTLAAANEPEPLTRETVPGVEDQLVERIVAERRRDPSIERAKLAPLLRRNPKDGTFRRAWDRASRLLEDVVPTWHPEPGASPHPTPKGGGGLGTPGAGLAPGALRALALQPGGCGVGEDPA